MAARAAEELQDGFYVNLGIGIPTLVANFIPKGMSVRCNRRTACSASALFPLEEDGDADLINAGKQTVTDLAGRVLFQLGRFICHDPRRPYQYRYFGRHAGGG